MQPSYTPSIEKKRPTGMVRGPPRLVVKPSYGAGTRLVVDEYDRKYSSDMSFSLRNEAEDERVHMEALPSLGGEVD